MLKSFGEWWHKPYDAEMSATRWALFLLFLIVVAGLWASVINMMKKAV
jgi:hypothetical protein